MEIQDYVIAIKKIYDFLLSFVENENENENESEYDFQSLKEQIESQQILANKQELQSLLHLIGKITKNHHRHPYFLQNIEKILSYLKDIIKRTFSNQEIFDIFENNKRILLFLFKREILTMNETIISSITKNDSLKHYFNPEIKSFNEIDDDFEKKRQIGENDSFICSLIRQDLVEEFISYVNRNNISLSSTIKPSIFETNSFLIDKEPSLIEYSAFFGSIQIFQFLNFNKIELKPSLWLYTIHSKNAELIHLLESNRIEPEDKTYEKCLKESILCHHNDIAIYIKENLMNEKIEKKNLENEYNKNILSYSFAYYNYAFIPIDMNNNNNNKFIFYYLCHYNYVNLLKLYLNENELNLNEKIKLKSNSSKKISALQIAAERSNLEIVRLLLSQNDIEIDSSTFKNCQKLNELTIPKTVLKIGDFAFSNCKSLSLISFEIPSKISSLNTSLFSFCISLIEIKIPSSVKLIGLRCFEGCISLKKVLFESPCFIKNILDYAFQDCSSLIEIAIPSSVNSIGMCCFNNCKSLQKVSFEKESSISTLNQSAFCGCVSLEELKIPPSVTDIKWYCFENCFSLKQIEIPSSVSSIGDFAFKNCSSIKKISIPSSVKLIGFDLFDGCDALEEIKIPQSASLLSIGKKYNGNVIYI